MALSATGPGRFSTRASGGGSFGLPPRMQERYARARDRSTRLAVPARRWLGRGTAWLSAAGWLALAGALLGLVVGAAMAWTEFLVIGLTCAVALLLALGWTLGRAALDVSFELHHNRVTVGETASGRVELRNRARRLLFPSRVELVVGRGSAHFLLPALGHGEAHEQLFDVPTRRRDVIRIGPVSSVRTDPLRLLRRVQRWSDCADLYVHPVTVSITTESNGFLRDVEGVTTQDLSSNDVSFHALREYVPGDDRRAVHWRTTARTGKLMVRQFEETRRAHLLIVLPTAAGDYDAEEDFESAISVAGSLARHAFREEREVSVYTTSGPLSAQTGPMMMDRLAAIEAAPAALPLRDLTARAARAVPHASVCALLAGSLADARQLSSAREVLPVAVATFALRCAWSAKVARGRIGDLTIIDLPSVDELPRAMRSLG